MDGVRGEWVLVLAKREKLPKVTKDKKLWRARLPMSQWLFENSKCFEQKQRKHFMLEICQKAMVNYCYKIV